MRVNDLLNVFYEVILHEVSDGDINAQRDVCISFFGNIVQKINSLLENPHVDAVDEAGLLSYGNEINGTDERTVIIFHSGESFEASELMVHVVLGLEMEEYLVSAQCGADLAFYLKSPLGI